MMKKEVKKNNRKNIKKSNKIFDILIKILNFIKNNRRVIYMCVPFLLMDLFTRGLGHKIGFYKIYRLVPNLFTLIWILFIVGVSISFKKSIGKKLYLFFFILSFGLFITNNVYYSMTDTFFDFSLVLLAGEGSSYIKDALLTCNIWVYVLSALTLIVFIFAYKNYPNNERNNYKSLIITLIVFIILHTLTPFLLGKKNDELTWSTWKNPRNIYISFNDNNKSMRISGLYEYSIRNFYITFIKPKKTDNEEELTFLEDVYNRSRKKN